MKVTVFGPAEQNMTMKEIDPLASESKEIHDLNDSTMDTTPPALEGKGGDETWHHEVMDVFSSDNENETIDSPRKEDEDGILHHGSDWSKDTDSLSSQTYDKDKERISPDHGSLVKVEEFTHINGNESQDSSSPCDYSSDMSKTNANLYTDKNVLEYELPELEVFYKEIDYHIVKDICVDEGRSEKDKSSSESSKDDVSGHLFPQPPSDSNHSEATKVSLMENDANSLGTHQCLNKEENDGKLVAEEWLKSSSVSSSDEDTTKDCDPAKDLVETSETNCDTIGKAAPDNSEKDSLMDQGFPSQEFGARSSLRSFLYSLDDGGNIVTQQPDQILDGKAVSHNRAASPAPVVAILADEVTEDVIADNLSDVRETHCSSSNVENLHEQSLVVKDGNSLDSSLTSNAASCNRDGTDEDVHAEQDDGNSNSFSEDSRAQLPSNSIISSKNDDAEADESNVSKNEQRDSGPNVLPVVSQLQYEEGERSFSAVTYSGSIAYSGSLSLRSDGSTTSGRSFAFPILQSEWNSSPVRMAKADRRHFRKHKGWRSGLLCCRF